jgi:hypothetical protein
MKHAYWLGALLSCAACDELQEAHDEPAPATAETMDAARPVGEMPGDAAAVLLDAQLGDAATLPADASDPRVLPRTDFEAAEALAQHGRACGVIGEGAWGPEFSPGAFCATLCFVQASCADLFRSQCSLDEEELEGPLLACLLSCNEQASDAVFEPVAQCGDGGKVPYDALCDGKPDCASGEDEAHCVFRCIDGEVTTGLGRCDGFYDCVDESDEDGCATLCGQPRSLGLANLRVP